MCLCKLGAGERNNQQIKPPVKPQASGKPGGTISTVTTGTVAFPGAALTAAGAGKALAGRGVRCSSVPPDEYCESAVKRWYYDSNNGTCVRYNVGRCQPKPGFLFCRRCATACMDEYEADPEPWSAYKGLQRGAPPLPKARRKTAHRVINFAEDEFGGSVKTARKKGGGLLGLRCRVEPPSADCTNGATMWFYDPDNGTCVAHDVGNCVTFGFLICQICVTTCMGARWGDPVIDNICRFQGEV
ncbi:uncharacterized protein LOC125946691 [Dermacentor silvarum]|uniref:uncharacterized protein LOC125946691 n=1 Tax=Dermacentor silvarum TaxID=543639 RepID=UPI0021015B70|nr:uncharacterized protein LOC125946691 [Dermacentor silvarum]